MNKGKAIARQITQWILAVICAGLILNLVSFGYYHPASLLNRSGGSSPSLLVPHQRTLYATEGWGNQEIDSYGYVNPDLPREEAYYCIIGSSHTEGFYSAKGERYSDLLNAEAGYENSLKFYNIAHSAYFFDHIVKHFRGIVQEFPGMQGLVIETGSTDFTVNQLTAALEQVDYSEEEDSVAALLSRQGMKGKVLTALRYHAPLLRLLSLQWRTYKGTGEAPRDSGGAAEDPSFDSEEYRAALDQVMALMRSEYDGEILIVYHPQTSLNADGTLQVHQSGTDEIFEEVCRAHDIGFIHMGEDFKAAYENDRQAAYGFWNTTLMTGHINSYGHQLIAGRISEYLRGREDG